MINGLLFVLLIISSILLIGVVLIQRGRGGGLAGAFGGTGGATAFGTKAGDIFTKITIYVACVWVGLNMLLVFRLNHSHESAMGADPEAPKSAASSADDKAAGAGDATKDLTLPPVGTSGAPDAKPAEVPAPAAPEAPKAPADPAAPAEKKAP